MNTEQQKDEQLWEMAKARVGFCWSFISYFIVNAFLIVVWFFTSGTESYFWPMWPLMGWGVGVAFQYFHAYHGNKMISAREEFEKFKNNNYKSNKNHFMKQVLVIISMFIAGMAAAQSKYEGAMAKGLEQFKAAKTVDDMNAASAFFERVGDAEKDKWLPYYYAAQATYFTGWMDLKADKDKVAGKSKDLIAKAEAIEKNNSEIFCLHQMVAILQMTVDPMARYQSYGAEARNALESATKADPNNPRIYLLNGQTLLRTPEAFGGGKAVSKKLAEKAIALFKIFKPDSPFHPDWGKDDADKLLAACQ